MPGAPGAKLKRKELEELMAPTASNADISGPNGRTHGLCWKDTGSMVVTGRQGVKCYQVWHD